jgi:hypothetical protein
MPYRRTLSDGEKLSYIDAVKCLQRRPSLTSNRYPGAQNRFDDFQATHIVQTPFIHWSVSFSSPTWRSIWSVVFRRLLIPVSRATSNSMCTIREIWGVTDGQSWHRYFVAAYESALRTECNYDGGQPLVIASSSFPMLTKTQILGFVYGIKLRYFKANFSRLDKRRDRGRLGWVTSIRPRLWVWWWVFPRLPRQASLKFPRKWPLH